MFSITIVLLADICFYLLELMTVWENWYALFLLEIGYMGELGLHAFVSGSLFLIMGDKWLDIFKFYTDHIPLE
jgi:hypothetical protein